MKIRYLQALSNHKIGLVSFFVLISLFILTLIYQENISEWVGWILKNEGESNSAIVRNIVLAVVVPIVALPLALWRLIVADRQSKTAQLSLLNERFKQGVEMLVSPRLATRLGGISILEQLAKESVIRHHIQIVELFSTLIRNPPRYEEEILTDTKEKNSVDENLPKDLPALRVDLQTMLWALERRSNEGKAIEKEQNYIFDFRKSKLSLAQFDDSDWSSTQFMFADLSNAFIENCDMKRALLTFACLTGATFITSNLSEAHLGYADLSEAEFMEVNLVEANLEYCNLNRAVFYIVDLTKARLCYANLSEVEFVNVNFLDADLTNANFSGTVITNAINLTQVQINQSIGKPENLRDLSDLKDANTGKTLIWNN